MSKPVYSLGKIITQLTTSWGDGDTAPRTWYSDPDDSVPFGTGATIFYSLDYDWSHIYLPDAVGVVAMDPKQMTAAQLAFQLWDDVVPFSFQRDDELGPWNGDTITFAYSSSTGGKTFDRPDVQLATNGNRSLDGAQIWFDSTALPNTDPGMVLGGYGYDSGLHEIGHSLGLSHPGPYNYDPNGPVITYANDAVYAQDNRQYTVMSYFGYYDTTLNGGKGGWTQDGSNWAADGGTASGTLLYPQTPMVHDIAAIQAKYGADYTTRSADTVYGFHSNIAAGPAGSVDEGQIYDFAKNAHPLFTIWDGGGNDTLDCSGYSGLQRIDLTPGHFSSVDGMTDNVAIAFGCTIENAIGGTGSDVFITSYGHFSVDGGGGRNTLDYSWIASPIKVDLPGGDVFKTGVKLIPGSYDVFTHIQNFVGGSANDTFIGGSVGNFSFDGGGGLNNTLDESSISTNATLDLKAGTLFKGTVGSGSFKLSLGTDSFSHVQSFLTGQGNDTLKTIADGNSYFFDGGDGYDTFDFSGFTSAITIDLQQHTVDKGLGTKIGDLGGGILGPVPVWFGTDSFADVDSFKGGAKNDTLIDGAGSHSFDGGLGIDTVVLHGSSKDYAVMSYLASDARWHTAVDAKSSTSMDGHLDLVSVEHLQCWDTTLTLTTGTLAFDAIM